ncbi:MAG: M18 family aminopeptidase [Polyangiaceae bacterium]|nr:M18 family aminopeptidase [Polyangiaceae bacterium]
MPQAIDAKVADLLAFINAAPSPYHVVRQVEARLLQAGFSEFDLRQPWKVTPSARGFTVCAGGTILAFQAGTRPPAEGGFLIVGAHTDSPNLRIKPKADLVSLGMGQFNVEVYGGVLLHTWFDRDLSVAGRVSLRGGRNVLVDFARPLCRIPNLAIHLDREVNTRGFIPNAQTHLPPLCFLEPLGKNEQKLGLSQILINECSSELQTEDPSHILSWDLCLYDTQPATLGGANNDFIWASRLDNLASCHAALSAFVADSSPSEATKVMVLYDHEEVGSQSAAGARSFFLPGVLERLAEEYEGQRPGGVRRALAQSLLISADMAHAVHPNYAERHDKQHQPRLGQGPVLKSNVNQSYATDSVGAATFIEACQSVGANVQHFTSRNDMPCGSTVGPISAARTGIRSLDVGSPMLSMHSCRELAAAADVVPMISALTTLFQNPPRVDPGS